MCGVLALSEWVVPAFACVGSLSPLNSRRLRLHARSPVVGVAKFGAVQLSVVGRSEPAILTLMGSDLNPAPTQVDVAAPTAEVDALTAADPAGANSMNRARTAHRTTAERKAAKRERKRVFAASPEGIAASARKAEFKSSPAGIAAAQQKAKARKQLKAEAQSRREAAMQSLRADPKSFHEETLTKLTKLNQE